MKLTFNDLIIYCLSIYFNSQTNENYFCRVIFFFFLIVIDKRKLVI